MDLRIAGYQMCVSRDIAENTRKICGAIEWAAESGAEVLLTPEGSLSGYTHEFDARAAEDALIVVTKRARELNVGLALGTCFVESDGKCYNQIRFTRPDGEYLGFHSKTLRCGSIRGQPRGEVNHYGVADLRVFPWREGLYVGGLICNDLWANPACTPMPDTHLCRQLGAMGARVIFHAVNGGRDGSSWSQMVWQFHEANLRMRARACGVWIATADSAYPEALPCSAPSGIVSPAGDFVCRTAPRGERLFVHTVVLEHGIHLKEGGDGA